MYENLVTIHNELLLNVADAKDVLQNATLTTFFPMRGAAYTGELMVIGRAVNGWASSWTPHDAVSEERRAEIIQEVVASSIREDGCPMKWVAEAWGRSRNEGYNSRTSAFWRTIRGIATSLLGKTDDWWSHLVWSDLYKVAPSEGGNPASRLIRAQAEQCKLHLAEELRVWRPKRILFLTGWAWAEAFVNSLGRKVTVVSKPCPDWSRPVHWTGTIELPDGNQPSVVVCVHPQGKAESRLVADVVGAFARPDGIATPSLPLSLQMPSGHPSELASRQPKCCSQL